MEYLFQKCNLAIINCPYFYFCLFVKVLFFCGIIDIINTGGVGSTLDSCILYNFIYSIGSQYSDFLFK